MHSKLDHMRIFKVVAETGSLSDAAKVLNRTPSAISMSLKQFTKLLGNELFETDRKSTLTPLGQFVLEQSRNVLKDFDDSIEIIQRYANGNYGTVRIASVPSFSTKLLPNIVKNFSHKLPDVRIEIRDMDSDLINKAVRNGIVDFGVASQIGGISRLKSELIVEEPLGVICQNRSALANCTYPLHWEDLTEEKFISNDLIKLVKNPYLETLRKNAKLHIPNIASLLSFISEGFGVTVLPETAIPDDRDLCFVPLADNSAKRKLFVIQHIKHRLNPAAKLFKQYITDEARIINQR